MGKWLCTDGDEVNRLNTLCQGKTIVRVGVSETMGDDITIYFTDGTYVRISTLGGLEIEHPQ